MIRRLVLQHSLSFVLDWIAAAVSGIPDIHQTDLLILLAIWSANSRHLNEDQAMLYRICFGDRLVPLERRRGTSRSAISRFLNLPLETVRRRIEVLLKLGHLEERQDGLICRIFDGDLGSCGADAERRSAGLVARLYENLDAAGFALPPAEWIARSGNQRVDRVAPEWVRAVTRLTVEYALLIVSEAMHAFDVSFPQLLVLFTILHHNVDHLSDDRQDSCADEIVPDRLRRGISYAGVTRSIAMPWATVRRRILDLTSQELVDRTPGGVIVPARVVQRHIHDTHFALHNNKYLTALFGTLQSLGEYRRQRAEVALASA